MDPITATTTVITLVTFIKDLIDVGQSIKHSIDQVRENRRRIRDLTDDILSTLSKLAELSRVNNDTFQTPAQLSTLGDLKADMLHVLSICSKISPVQPSPGFRGFGSQIRVWIKRDNIEAEIKRLKKHVNKCYLQFTVFATAQIEDTTHRTEHTALRVEHTILVNNVENQAKLRQLEGLMSHVLLKEQFGKNVMNQTTEIIASDTTHETLEFQYLSTQTLRLLDSLQQLVVNNIFFLDKPLWVASWTDFTNSATPEHILHQVLGMILTIRNSSAKIPFASIDDVIFSSGNLLKLGMKSEATAYELLTRKILRRWASEDLNLGAVSQLACSSECLSRLYQHQLQWDLADEANQEAMDWCRLWQEIFPDTKYQPVLAAILTTRSNILRRMGQPEGATLIAEEAVTLFRTMLGELIESSAGSSLADWPEPDIDNKTTFLDALLALSRALSSVGQHFEAYKASREGFRILLKFSSFHSPIYSNDSSIDAFIDHMCKVAEGGGFCLAMLADNVILFRDLSRISPKEFSSQFLRLLHAYAYFSPQDCPHFGNLRVFLEPGLDSPSPVPAVFNIDDFKPYGGVIEDAVRDYYSGDTRDAVPLIKIIFTTYSDEAILALNESASKLMTVPLVDSYSLDWIVHNISYELLSVPTRSRQLALQEISTKAVGHFRTLSNSVEPVRFTNILWFSARGFWIVGLLDDAKSLCDEALDYLRRSSSEPNHNEDQDSLREWCMCQTFVLCDIARIPEAIEAVQNARTTRMLMDGTQILHYCMIQIRILQRTGRKREALQLLRNIMAEVKQLYEEENFRYHGHLLIADLAAARIHVGQLRKAVKNGKRVVAACQEDVEQNDGEEQKCALTHSLTVLSDCLAAVGRIDEALLAAKEATSMYTQNASHMWGSFCYTIRRQELGANAFSSLSLRLATTGQLVEAHANAEKAIELYRELVSLAPRHLPVLATSLRNLASILAMRRVSCIDEPISAYEEAASVSACEEAVSIMRKVAETETYFLRALGEALDQLAGYLLENRDTERAAAATSEAVEVRRKIDCLPPQPEFLFSEFEMESEDEDDGWATATESEEYHDAAAIEEVVSEAGSATSAQELPLLMQAIEAKVEGSNAASQAVVPSTDEMFPASQREEPTVRDTAKKGVADLLSTPFEVKLSSTPMDLLWWILLGVLSLLVAVVGVALAVLWIRVHSTL
ncbi:hypothetical protein FB451DRAFT_1483903 [Mycena latifolia]|nr:hypothetical protein FB451DRAFT_1483903 [Mycena latifolia]